MTLWSRLSGQLRKLLPHAAALAALVGGVEAGIILTRQQVLHQFVWSDPDVLWMAPTGYLILALGVAGFAALLGTVIPVLGRPRLYVALVSMVGLAAIVRLLTLQRLHPAAILVLAVGLGIQISRWLAPEDGRLRRLTRIACWLWIPLAGVAALALAARGRSAARTNDDLPASVPSIVFIVWDTVRELSLSVYGYDRPTTPALERWAKRGVVFDRAYATSSWTLPSHASMFTGRLAPELSTDWLEPLDETHPTIAEHLTARGFRTAGFLANLNYLTKETGLARGFQAWDDYPVSFKEILLNTELGQWVTGWRGTIALRGHDRKTAGAVTDAFLAWHARHADGPVFAFLNYRDAHVPYYAPDSLKARFRRDREQRDAYDAAIAYLDSEFDRLLQELDRRGALARTIVVLTSDHGESFGDHRLIGHGNSLYRQVLQVPLMLLAPGRAPAGLRISEPVSLRSLPATLMNLTGSDSAVFPGVSLTRLWGEGGGVNQDSPVLSALTPAPRMPPTDTRRNKDGELRSLVVGGFHYILNPNGSEEIFDLIADPLEERNVAGQGPDSLFKAMSATLRIYDSVFPRKTKPRPRA